MITNQINGKIYIGQTIQPLAQRLQRHFCLGESSAAEMGMAIKRAVKKYGKENFKAVVLEECDRSVSDDREKYYIQKYDSYNNGYNCTKGGDGGRSRDFFSIAIQTEIIDLYKLGFSLRALAAEYNVAKQTIKHVLVINNIALTPTRIYKFSNESRQQILDEVNAGISRKSIMIKWGISKGYLSQLTTGFHRI